MKKESCLRFSPRRACGFFSALLLLGGLHHAIAGGPIFVCQSGQPLLWPNGGVGIAFNPDQGTLGPLSNADAVAAVQAAFSVWEAVPTATPSFVMGPALPVAVAIN